ncbi:MAG: hypothetical protein HC869_04595, partial [Rhodospirillales bacterium]|nr:hypothetical protein [Rhodospirillales bacterium]
MKAYKNQCVDGTWIRPRLGLTQQAQERHCVLNPVASFINRFVTHSLTHTQSIGYVTLKHVLLEAVRGQIHPHLPREILKIVRDLPGVVSGTWHHLRHQTGALYFMGEQVPNPESRITLDSKCDKLGLEQALVDWRLSSEDKRSIRVMVTLIDSELRRLGLGRAEPDDWLVSDDTTWPDDVFGAYHHMGTTRMGVNPKNSVVNPDARVHGIENLYIAGSSIFPTVGCANP